MVRIRQDPVEILICLASSRRPRSFDLCRGTPSNGDGLSAVVFIVIIEIIVRGFPLLKLNIRLPCYYDTDLNTHNLSTCRLVAWAISSASLAIQSELN